MCSPCPERIGKKITKVMKWHEGEKIRWWQRDDGKEILGKGRLTDKIIHKMQNYYGMAIRQNILSSQNNGKEKALHSMKKIQFSPHCGTVQICLTTKRDMHFVLGNPIVGVNIGKMEAMKIISYLSICQKLSRIYLCQYF